MRNADHRPDDTCSPNTPSIVSGPDANQPLFCTACSTIVSETAASYFYSQCDPSLGHHAYGYLAPCKEHPSPCPTLSTCLTSNGQVHPVSPYTRGVNQLITTRNMSKNRPVTFPTPESSAGAAAANDCLPDLVLDDESIPTPAKPISTDNEAELTHQSASIADCWSRKTRDLSAKIQYLINPVGLSLPKLCRAGATALRFIYLLLDSLGHKQCGGIWGDVKARIFLDPSAVRKICLTVTGNCPADLGPAQGLRDEPQPEDVSVAAIYHRAHTFNAAGQVAGASTNPVQTKTLVHQAERAPPPHNKATPILYILSKQVETDGWIKYPGILKARHMTNRWKALLTDKRGGRNSAAYPAIILELEWFQRLIFTITPESPLQPIITIM